MAGAFCRHDLSNNHISQKPVMVPRDFHRVLTAWLVTGFFSAAQAGVIIPPIWLRVARDLAEMHHLPGQVGWTGVRGGLRTYWQPL